MFRFFSGETYVGEKW